MLSAMVSGQTCISVQRCSPCLIKSISSYGALWSPVLHVWSRLRCQQLPLLATTHACPVEVLLRCCPSNQLGRTGSCVCTHSISASCCPHVPGHAGWRASTPDPCSLRGALLGTTKLFCHDMLLQYQSPITPYRVTHHSAQQNNARFVESRSHTEQLCALFRSQRSHESSGGAASLGGPSPSSSPEGSMMHPQLINTLMQTLMQQSRHVSPVCCW